MPSGKFTSQSNAVCQTWTTCGAGTEQAIAPTASSDRVCRNCNIGFFSNAQTNFVCLKVTDPCPAGSYETQAPSTTQDRVCQPCPAGVSLVQQ